jgi:DnaK suppressor protein
VDEAHARELLAAERARIERQLGELGPHGDDELSHDDQHLADEATELYEDEYEAGLADRLRQELDAVERAEARFAEGTYGRSIESGEPIPDERLELVPTAERTADEQERFERGR